MANLCQPRCDLLTKRLRQRRKRDNGDLSAIERFDPFSEPCRDRAGIKRRVDSSGPLQLLDSGKPESPGGCGIPAPQFDEPGGDLDQALKSEFRRAFLRSPDLFPGLVRLEEAARIEELDPVPERGAGERTGATVFQADRARPRARPGRPS